MYPDNCRVFNGPIFLIKHSKVGHPFTVYKMQEKLVTLEVSDKWCNKIKCFEETSWHVITNSSSTPRQAQKDAHTNDDHAYCINVWRKCGQSNASTLSQICPQKRSIFVPFQWTMSNSAMPYQETRPITSEVNLIQTFLHLHPKYAFELGRNLTTT